MGKSVLYHITCSLICKPFYTSEKLYLVIELPVGYALFKHCEGEEIATKECAATFNEFSRLSKIMVWESFQPFSSQEQALSEMQKIASCNPS